MLVVSLARRLLRQALANLGHVQQSLLVEVGSLVILVSIAQHGTECGH